VRSLPFSPTFCIFFEIVFPTFCRVPSLSTFQPNEPSFLPARHSSVAVRLPSLLYEELLLNSSPGFNPFCPFISFGILQAQIPFSAPLRLSVPVFVPPPFLPPLDRTPPIFFSQPSIADSFLFFLSGRQSSPLFRLFQRPPLNDFSTHFFSCYRCLSFISRPRNLIPSPPRFLQRLISPALFPSPNSDMIPLHRSRACFLPQFHFSGTP